MFFSMSRPGGTHKLIYGPGYKPSPERARRGRRPRVSSSVLPAFTLRDSTIGTPEDRVYVFSSIDELGKGRPTPARGRPSKWIHNARLSKVRAKINTPRL